MADEPVQLGTHQAPEGVYVEVTEGGPYMFHGGTPLVQQFIVHDAEGTSIAYQEGESFAARDKVAVCRCGLSDKKPFCDGSHKHAAEHGIDLRETATFASEFRTSQVVEGPGRFLSDDEKLCAFARFCDQGQSIWNEVQMAGEQAQDAALDMARHCPGGRLIIWDTATKQPIEPAEDPSVGLIEDMAKHCSGPLMVRGGVPVHSSNGESYEVRNRQALCRCGMSRNKPFCDASHVSAEFRDGLPTEPKADGKRW